MAYAVVVSLEQTLEPLLEFQIPSKYEISTNSFLEYQIPSKSEIYTNLELNLIYNQLYYLKSFFARIISLEDVNSVEEVERKIKDVVQNSQDLIESHISDLFHSGAVSWISGLYPELVKVNAKLDPLVKELKAMEDYLTGDQQPPAGFGSRNDNTVGVGSPAAAASSSLIDFGRNDALVGMDEELLMLTDRLITRDYYSTNDDLNLICIVGMGGIGKTTLAKQVYLRPITIEHFDVRLFVEIGIEYKLKELLLRLVHQVGFTKGDQVAAVELGSYIYKRLYRKRFLIVLDDMWDIEVWDQLRRFFPNNRNGSSIILTTRISNMARDVCSTHANVVEKQFLDNEKSWELLRKMALSDIDMGLCPPELEKVGKSIAQNLGGLPLAIVMIGELLSRSPPTLESWSAVAQNTHLPIRESEIPAFLNLSYTHLPQHLKACFLYLGLFPPNTNISTALLIKLWIAEGFIEEGGRSNRSLEEEGEEYLHELVGRSLVIIDELKSIGGIKTCRVHQLLLDLCVSESRQQKLYHIVNEGSARFSKKNQRRLGIYRDTILGYKEPDWGVRSLVFTCPQSEQPLELNLGFRLLRVLHALSFSVREFSDEVLKLVRLRYLAITYNGELPSSISRLRNLEFLIIHRSLHIYSYMFLPLEIWKLQKLRHLECMGSDLPDPSTAAATAHDNVVRLTKLVTLLGVSARSCTESVLARIPNLIKLGIRFDLTKAKVESSCFGAISSCLHRLESFKCVGTVMNRGLGSEVAFSSLNRLPYGLIKLTLSGCGFDWGKHMTIISQLPNLQVLKLQWRAFCGSVWETIEGEFVSLKLLVLELLNLKRWNTDSSHLPRLEQLHIRHCYNLIEIPSLIGEIPTLQVIVVDRCSDSANDSATLIKEEQESLGNETLQILII